MYSTTVMVNKDEYILPVFSKILEIEKFMYKRLNLMSFLTKHNIVSENWLLEHCVP